MISKELKLGPGESVYLASDFHLGMPNQTESIAREKKVVDWLSTIQSSCKVLILVGDVFDFWFEYKHVVPKGAVRLLGKLAELSDKGVSIYLFNGNHDLWHRDYLAKELGLEILRSPVSFLINDTKVYVAHGDGYDPRDIKYRIINWIFKFPLFQWMFGWLHPTVGYSVANLWSNFSRKTTSHQLKEENVQLTYCEHVDQQTPHDYYVMGDSHYPNELPLTSGAKFINLGDWIDHDTYAVFNGQKLELKKFKR